MNATLTSRWSFETIGVNRNVSVTSIESDISLRSPTASAAVNRIFSSSCFPQLSSETSCDDSISIVYSSSGCSLSQCLVRGCLVCAPERTRLVDLRILPLGKTAEALKIRDGGGHPLDHFERHLFRLHIGCRTRMNQRRRPHQQRKENLLPVQIPRLVEGDTKAALFPHLVQIALKQIAFPG